MESKINPDMAEAAMEYQVIARKWRPQKFAEVVGQAHIIKTLQNELLRQRTAHAYLFVGPRGIGKTTIARIFAKALNCERSPVAEPCCECSSCLAISAGNNMDLIEIDGASNNSVEDVRRLREEVLYAPVNGRFKVYIIDEVHMLSGSAWNALLKTIEEPPAHAKFLFATTEAHKLLATVVSRCQRFDLRRISFRDISDQLRKIAKAEEITIDDAAISVISRAADGGMRDAQSLLDQIIAFSSGGKEAITDSQVLEIFGLAAFEELRKLVAAMFSNDSATLVSCLHALAVQGKNLEKLLEDILEFIRGMQICMIVDDPATILETGEDVINVYREHCAGTNCGTVRKMLEFLSPLGRSLHDALNKQVYLETTLLKSMRIAHAVEIETLVQRLNELRKNGEMKALEQPAPTPTAAMQKAPDLPAAAPMPLQAPAPIPEKSAPPPPVSLPVDSPVEPISAPEQKVFRLENPKQEIPSPKPGSLASPESLWHELIVEMEHGQHQLLKAYMQEARPLSFSDGVLRVVYDEDSDSFMVPEIEQAKNLLEQRLKKISGVAGASIDIRYEKGVLPVHDSPHTSLNDLAEVRKRVEKNRFVRDVVDLFNGEIVEVRG